MSFRDDELKRLSAIALSEWPCQAAREHPYVLAPALVLENLHEDVWASALSYFDAHEIAWWLSDAERGERRRLGLTHRLPTGHMNSSQIACVNHLEPARLDRELALAVARNLDPRVAEVRDTAEGGYVAFEWVGKREYLSEPGAFGRGAYVTSLDALMRVTLDGGALALLVVEWKYLESYPATSVATSGRTDRVAVYRDLIEGADSPLAPGDAERLFYEPYYQLARQTLLAARAVVDPDTPETEWLQVHVIPEGNVALREGTATACNLGLVRSRWAGRRSNLMQEASKPATSWGSPSSTTIRYARQQRASSPPPPSSPAARWARGGR
jgi:hypothetical protein